MSTRGKTSFAHIIPRGSGAMSEHKAGGEQAGMGGEGAEVRQPPPFPISGAKK